MQWIQTYTGRMFFPLDPDAGQIDIRDIAHALSLQCRFNGHCRCFYSVAEHSVRVSNQLTGREALWGLLHDAAEAYLTDLPRPVKKQMPLFEELEDRLLAVIMKHFGLPPTMPAAVRKADDDLLATEARDLMGKPPQPWSFGGSTLDQTITPLLPAAAEQAFLARFAALTGASHS